MSDQIPEWVLDLLNRQIQEYESTDAEGVVKSAFDDVGFVGLLQMMACGSGGFVTFPNIKLQNQGLTYTTQLGAGSPDCLAMPGDPQLVSGASTRGVDCTFTITTSGTVSNDARIIIGFQSNNTNTWSSNPPTYLNYANFEGVTISKESANSFMGLRSTNTGGTGTTYGTSQYVSTGTVSKVRIRWKDEFISIWFNDTLIVDNVKRTNSGRLLTGDNLFFHGYMFNQGATNLVFTVNMTAN